MAQPPFVSDDHARGRRLAGHGAGRVDGPGILRGICSQRRQVDRFCVERPSLVQAGEQQQVVDEPGHAGRLAVDAAHGGVQVAGAIGEAVLEELGVASDGGEGSPQLVRGIGDEAPQPRLGRLSLTEGSLDAAEHHVEGTAELAHLCAPVGFLDTPAQVARGDLACRVRHLLQGPQAEPDDYPGRERERDEDRSADKELEAKQVVQEIVGRRERDRLDEHVADLGAGEAVEQGSHEHPIGVDAAGPGGSGVDGGAPGCRQAREGGGDDRRHRLRRAGERLPGHELLAGRGQFRGHRTWCDRLVGHVLAVVELRGAAEAVRHQVRRPEQLPVELPDRIMPERCVGDGIGRRQGEDDERAQDGDQPELQAHGKHRSSLRPRPSRS